MSTDGVMGSGRSARTGDDHDSTTAGRARTGDGRRAAVIVVSTAAAKGEAVDGSGPLLVDWLRASGYECPPPLLAEDGGRVEEALRHVLGMSDGAPTQTRPQPGEDSAAGPAATSAPDAAPRFVVTSGGTGLNRLDRTPQVTAALLDYQTPGIMHALWTAGLQSTPTAVMSRGVAGVRGSTFVVNLPGSAGGVRDGISVLTPLLPHIQDQLEDCGGASPVSLR